MCAPHLFKLGGGIKRGAAIRAGIVQGPCSTGPLRGPCVRALASRFAKNAPRHPTRRIASPFGSRVPPPSGPYARGAGAHTNARSMFVGADCHARGGLPLVSPLRRQGSPGPRRSLPVRRACAQRPASLCSATRPVRIPARLTHFPLRAWLPRRGAAEQTNHAAATWFSRGLIATKSGKKKRQHNSHTQSATARVRETNGTNKTPNAQCQSTREGHHPSRLRTFHLHPASVTGLESALWRRLHTAPS